MSHLGYMMIEAVTARDVDVPSAVMSRSAFVEASVALRERTPGARMRTPLRPDFASADG